MYAARATRQVSEWVMVQRRMLEDERDSEPKSDSKSHRDAKGSQEKSGRRITHLGVVGLCQGPVCVIYRCGPFLREHEKYSLTRDDTNGIVEQALAKDDA